MHQSFDDYAERDARRTRILFQEDSHIGDRDTRKFAYKVKAADLMVQKLREGTMILLGDMLVDVRDLRPEGNPILDMDSFKVSHAALCEPDNFPNPNGEMSFCVGGDDATPEETREIVEPAFDFNTYYGIK